jgi:hypothetical protein
MRHPNVVVVGAFDCSIEITLWLRYYDLLLLDLFSQFFLVLLPDLKSNRTMFFLLELLLLLLCQIALFPQFSRVHLVKLLQIDPAYFLQQALAVFADSCSL